MNNAYLPKNSSASIPYPWCYLGTWSMAGDGYGRSDFRLARETLEMAFEDGVRHFDSAGLYGDGAAERLLGKVFSSCREEIFISTKGGFCRNGRQVSHDASPERLRKGLMESLERLGTGYVDLYSLHWPDSAVPLAESISVLRDLQQEGLCRYWGIGNFTENEVLSALDAECSIPHQVTVNALFPNKAVLAAGHDANRCFNLAVSLLNHGLFSAGVSTVFGKKDHRSRRPEFKNDALLLEIARLSKCFDSAGMSLEVGMIFWVLAFLPVDGVILGARTPAQWKRLRPLFSMLSTALGPDFNGLFSDADRQMLQNAFHHRFSQKLASDIAALPVRF